MRLWNCREARTSWCNLQPHLAMADEPPRCRVQDIAKKLSSPGCNFLVPKLHDMVKYEISIPRLGSAGITSSAFGEAAHKHLKAASADTNQHRDMRDVQVRMPLASGRSNLMLLLWQKHTATLLAR